MDKSFFCKYEKFSMALFVQLKSIKVVISHEIFLLLPKNNFMKIVMEQQKEVGEFEWNENRLWRI